LSTILLELLFRVYPATCLFDETVKEVKWGLKNIMQSLVHKERSELTREDKMFLNRQGFDVKPEMVSLPVTFAHLPSCFFYMI